MEGHATVPMAATSAATTKPTTRVWKLFVPPATILADETAPLSWRNPQRVGINGDVFDEAVPDAFIARVYGVMVAAYWHDFQVLTKRPERRLELLRDGAFRELVAGEAARLTNTLRGVDRVRTPGTHSRSFVGTVNLAAWDAGAARNIWEGVTAEDQRWADQRIPLLLATPAAVRFVSCDPLLGPVELKPRYLHPLDTITSEETRQTWTVPRIAWVIVGGESGPRARPCDVKWIRGIVRQCRTAGVAAFVKQLGAKPFEHYRDAIPSVYGHGWPVDLRWAGNDSAVPAVSDPDWEPDWWAPMMKSRNGLDPAEWLEELRVREFPEVLR